MSDDIYNSIYDVVSTNTPIGPDKNVLISKEATHYIAIKVSDRVDKNENMVIDKITDGKIKMDIVLENSNEIIILFFIRQLKTSRVNKIEVTNGYYKKFREEFEPLTNASDIFDIINKNSTQSTNPASIQSILNITTSSKEAEALKHANQGAIDAIDALKTKIEENLKDDEQKSKIKAPPRENDVLDNSSFLKRITKLIENKISYISNEYEEYVRKYIYKKDIEENIKQECDNFIEMVDKIHISIEKSSKYSNEFKEANNITISKIFEKHLPDEKLLSFINTIIFPELEADQYKSLSALLNSSIDIVNNIRSKFIMSDTEDEKLKKSALYEKQSILELIDHLKSSFFKLVSFYEDNLSLLLNRDPDVRKNFHNSIIVFSKKVKSLYLDILERIQSNGILTPEDQDEIFDKMKNVRDEIYDEIKRIDEKYTNFSKTKNLQSKQAYNLGKILDLDLSIHAPLNTIELTNPSYLNYSHAISLMSSMNTMYNFMVRSIKHHNTLKGYETENTSLNEYLFDTDTMNIIGIDPSSSDINKENKLKDKTDDIRFTNFFYMVKHFMKLINLIRYNPIIYKLNVLGPSNFNMLFMNIDANVDKKQESYQYIYDSNYNDLNEKLDKKDYKFFKEGEEFLSQKNDPKNVAKQLLSNVETRTDDNNLNNTKVIPPHFLKNNVYPDTTPTTSGGGMFMKGGNIYGYTDSQLLQIKNRYLEFIFIDTEIIKRFFDEFQKVPNNAQMKLINELNNLIKDDYSSNMYNERVYNSDFHKNVSENLNKQLVFKDNKDRRKINIFKLLNILFDNQEYFNAELPGFYLKIRFFRRLMLDVINQFIYIKELIRCFEFQDPKFIQRMDNMLIKKNADNILTYVKIRNNEKFEYNRRFEIYFNKLVKTENIQQANNIGYYIDNKTKHYNSMLIKYNDDDYPYYKIDTSATKTNVFITSDEIKQNNILDKKNNFIFNNLIRNSVLKHLGQFPPPVFKETKNYFITNNETSNIKIDNYDHTYAFGKFTRIFYPKLSNKEVASNIPEITEKLLQGKPVFMLGYGASGAGKTSTLIYFNRAKENGILIELCRILASKGYTKLGVSTDEVYDTFHFNEHENKQRQDPTVIRVPCEGNIEFSFKMSEEKRAEFSNKKSRNIYIEDEEIFNSKEFRLDKDYEHNNTHIYRTDKELSDSDLKSYIFNSVASHLSVTNRKFSANSSLGELVTYLVDTDRLVKATTNNPNSSRSHTLVYLKFTLVDCHAIGMKLDEENPINSGDDPASRIIDEISKKTHTAFKMRKLPQEVNLIIGDFAGVENEFTCDKLNTVFNFANIKDEKENYKSYYGNSAIPSKEGNYDDGEGGQECPPKEESRTTSDFDFDCDADNNKITWTGGQVKYPGRNTVEIKKLNTANFGNVDTGFLGVIPPLNISVSKNVKDILLKLLIDDIHYTYRTITNIDEKKAFVKLLEKNLPTFFKEGGALFVDIGKLSKDEYSKRVRALLDTIDLQINFTTIESYLLEKKDSNSFDENKNTDLLKLYTFNNDKDKPKELYIKFLDFLLKQNINTTNIQSKLKDQILEFNKTESRITENIKIKFNEILKIYQKDDTKVETDEIDKIINDMKNSNVVKYLFNKSENYNKIVEYIIYFLFFKFSFPKGSNQTEIFNLLNTNLIGWNKSTAYFYQESMSLVIGTKFFNVIKEILKYFFKNKKVNTKSYTNLFLRIPEDVTFDSHEKLFITSLSEKQNVLGYIFDLVIDNPKFDTIKDDAKANKEKIVKFIANSLSTSETFNSEQEIKKIQNSDAFQTPDNFVIWVLYYIKYIQTFFSDAFGETNTDTHIKTFKTNYKLIHNAIYKLSSKISSDEIKQIIIIGNDYHTINPNSKTHLMSQLSILSEAEKEFIEADDKPFDYLKFDGYKQRWFTSDNLDYPKYIKCLTIFQDIQVQLKSLRSGFNSDAMKELDKIISSDDFNSVDKVKYMFRKVFNKPPLQINTGEYIYYCTDDIEYKENTIIGNLIDIESTPKDISNYMKYNSKINMILGQDKDEYTSIDNILNVKFAELYTTINTKNMEYIGKNKSASLQQKLMNGVSNTVLYNGITEIDENFFKVVKQNIKKSLEEGETHLTYLKPILEAVYQAIDLDVFSNSTILELREINEKVFNMKMDYEPLLPDTNEEEKKKKSQAAIRRGGAVSADLFFNNYNMMFYLLDILKQEKKRYAYIQNVCINRGMEGLLINKTLYDLRDTIQEILKVKNIGVMDMAPSIIDFHMKDYCPKYKSCFSNSISTINTKTIKSLLIELIFKKVVVNPDLSSEKIEKFYKDLQVCVFCVVNISRDPITNNPPPSPYIDINTLKHMFYYFYEEIFYSHTFIGFKDYTNPAESEVTPPPPKFTNYKKEFYKECLQLINIIDNKYSGTSGRSKFIDPIQSSDAYRDFKWLVSERINIVDTQVDKDGNKIEKVIKTHNINNKEYETSGLFSDFINKTYNEFYEIHKIVDFYLKYKDIFQKFFDFIDKSNAISTIGTIEYMDQISKFNTVNVLGVLEDSVLPEKVGYEEMNINIQKKEKVDYDILKYGY